MQSIKHSVLVITYNQELLVSRCINSILNQSVMPYEIIIGDDCSTDSTWEIIKTYLKNYPNIIKAYHNETNYGIFRNLNKIRSIPSGDVISCVAGDDCVETGLFESLNDVILKNSLIGKNESFIIITNSITRYPNGKDVIFSNYHFKNKNLMKARLRYGLSYREIGLSAKLFHSLTPLRLDVGYFADWLYCFEQIEKADKFYFINKPLSVYYTGIGVTSDKIGKLLNSKKQVLNIISKKYKNEFDFADKLYIIFEKSKINLVLKPNLINIFISYLLLMINMFNFSRNYSFFLNFKEMLLFSIPKKIKFFLKKLKYNATS